MKISILNETIIVNKYTCVTGFLEFQGFTWCSSRRVLLGIIWPCLLYESEKREIIELFFKWLLVEYYLIVTN